MDKQLRLDKFLADMQVGTRSEVKQYIRKGRVRINGQICKTPEYKITPLTDVVYFDDRRIDYNQFVYIMLYKPCGVVSASRDGKSKTVIDLLGDKARRDMFPVGRLDRDTEGLLLITNDGDLAHRLLSPKKHVDKVYFVRVMGKLTDEDKKAFMDGIDIGDDKPALPADLIVLSSGETSEAQVCIREGRYHQIKRMFEALGKQVIYLKRLSMGPLKLDNELPCGSFRELTEEEISLLKNYKVEGI